MEESCPFPPLQSLCELLGTSTFLVSLQRPARQAVPSPGDGGTGKWMPFPSGKPVPWSGFLHLHHGTAMTPGCQHHPHNSLHTTITPVLGRVVLPPCCCLYPSVHAPAPPVCPGAMLWLPRALFLFYYDFFFSSDNALTTHRKKSRSFPQKSQ